jgi:D-glycero-alpha-D-manno-heptose-7-phosphate kinase
MLKRDLSSRISTPTVDEAYETARRCGALGGKLLGAGGGGFLLFFASPERHDAIRRGLSPLREIEVGFDHVGSAIAYYRP